MKNEPRRNLQNPLYFLTRLLTDKRSLESCFFVAAIIVIVDWGFTSFLFQPYQQFLERIIRIDQAILSQVDIGYAPIVWLIMLALIISTLIIVITFAAQNIPKLIDLYMEEWRSLLFIWLLIGGGVHAVVIKLLEEVGLHREPSIILNVHLLSIVGLSSLPYTFSVLKSTKPHNVIDRILLNNLTLFRRLTHPRNHSRLKNPAELGRTQRSFFEMLNQLDDLLVYVPFKEPKANILLGVGELLSNYAHLKNQFPSTLFLISQTIREDISFKTLKSQLSEIEEARTFYEQKGLRLVGNAYHRFLEENQFDLSSLCAAQLTKVGTAAIQNEDQALVELIMLRFNTQFRFALKHGQRHNEPRNLYNLAFHYGQFISALVEAKAVENVKSSFFYLRFYSVECFKAALNSPSLAFILDTIAAEMKKIMILIHEQEWDMATQKALLDEFLLLDNPPGVDRREVAEFFISKNSVRVLQIGLGLYYFHHNLEDFALAVVQDTLQDLELMQQPQFLQVMDQVFKRLRFSGPTFWEDTDRGNLNIYYTSHADQIEKFQQVQLEQLKLFQLPQAKA